MAPELRESPPVVETVRQYLDRLLRGRHPIRDITNHFADRVAERLAVRLEDEYVSVRTTLEVLADPEATEALRTGERELQEEGLPPAWEDVRQDLGLGSRQAHPAR